MARITEVPYMKDYVAEIERLVCIRDGKPILRYDDGADIVDFCEDCGQILNIETEGDEEAVLGSLNAILHQECTYL